MSEKGKRPERLKSLQDLAVLRNGNDLVLGGGREGPQGRDRKNAYHPNRDSRQGHGDHGGQGGRRAGGQGRPRQAQHGDRGGGKDFRGGDRKRPPLALPLPCDVSECFDLEKDVGQWLGSRPCENFSLLFYRYVPRENDRDWTVEKLKDKLWKGLRDQGNRLAKEGKARHFLARQAELVDALRKCYGEKKVRQIKAETVGRLSIGFGNAGPLETGITLDRLYGLPYLPGTAVKGLCRSWAFEKIAEKWRIPPLSAEKIKKDFHTEKRKHRTPWEVLEAFLFASDKAAPGSSGPPAAEREWEALAKALKRAELDPPSVRSQNDWREVWEDSEVNNFCRIFGDQSDRGEVIFFDAYPTKEAVSAKADLFDLDIINVHYQDYYDSKKAPYKPPADYLSPIPNLFLTVAAGVRFRFVLAWRERRYARNRQAEESSDLLEEAATWLKNAVDGLGIGAKTAVGYGQMKPL